MVEAMDMHVTQHFTVQMDYDTKHTATVAQELLKPKKLDVLGEWKWPPVLSPVDQAFQLQR